MSGKCVLYCRVSTDKGTQDPENQAVLLRDWAKRLDLKIEKEYVDYQSGGTGNRESFQAMLEDLKSIKCRGYQLLFFSLDRFTREGVLPTLTYLNSLSTLGIVYKSLTEQWLDASGPFKEALVSIMATLAKQEKMRIGERTKAGLARVKREGSKSGRPIGRPVKDVDMEEAKRLLRSHSERMAAKMMGIPAATLRLRLHGRSEKKIKPMWSEPVHGILTTEGIFQEEETGDVVIRFDRNTGKPHCLNHRGELERCRHRHVDLVKEAV